MNRLAYARVLAWFDEAAFVMRFPDRLLGAVQAA